MYYFTSAIIAFLIGGIPFGFLLGKVFGGVDIRKSGSNNIGATNLTRVCGVKVGAWGYILDILKGVLPVLILPVLFNVDNKALLEITILSSVVIGHIFPVYLLFKGGKGVSVALGGLLVAQTLPAFSSLIVFIIIVLIFRYISLGSIIATTLFPIFIIMYDIILKKDLEIEFIIFGFVLALVVIVAHKSNIVRLIRGEENKLGSTSKSEKMGGE